jgi:hypothetical protein
MVSLVLIGILAYCLGYETLAYVSWGFAVLAGVVSLVQFGVTIGKAVKE